MPSDNKIDDKPNQQNRIASHRIVSSIEQNHSEPIPNPKDQNQNETK